MTLVLSPALSSLRSASTDDARLSPLPTRRSTSSSPDSQPTYTVRSPSARSRASSAGALARTLRGRQ